MRRLLVLGLIARVLASGPALADEGRDCLQHKDSEIRIKACSEFIRRDSVDVTAYRNRAAAYENIDRAIADYTKAIELAPDNAASYDARGRAYSRKGDYTRSVADVLKARELVGRATAQKTVAIDQNKRADETRASTSRRGGAVASCLRHCFPLSGFGN